MRTDVNHLEGDLTIRTYTLFCTCSMCSKKTTRQNISKNQRTLPACSLAGHEFPPIRGFTNLRTFVHHSPRVNGACPCMRTWAAATSAMTVAAKFWMTAAPTPLEVSHK
eukprot:s2245_g8.t1